MPESSLFSSTLKDRVPKAKFFHGQKHIARNLLSVLGGGECLKCTVQAHRSAGRGATSTILVVEDDALTRLVISDYLQECGFQVYGAATVPEAIDILQSAGSRIDLVFSDIRLPGEMDGIHLARWVNENRAGLPVIVTSGDAARSEAARELCHSENMSFFAKPYEVARVVPEIEKAVETSGLQR
jgi:DNA-binding NtrC family response regulator